MKIAERFLPGVTQHEIDFVNIDTDLDLPLFIDPFFLSTRTDSWSVGASRTVRNFFQTFVTIARDGDHARARAMFNHLHEPNETCLGLSKGGPAGRAIGDENADMLFQSILQSQAVTTGVVEDLEDFRIFIPGIDKDKVSDMTTNIIRRHLIEYTKNQCALWGIPMAPGVPSEFYWDASQRAWHNSYEDTLVIDGRKILLTPKSVVSFVKRYTPKKYHSAFVLEFLRHEHLAMGSSLVQFRKKSGEPFVTKKSLEEHVAPFSKEYLADFTAAHPEVFRDFRVWAKDNSSSVANVEIADEDPIAIAAFLRSRLIALSPGSAHASSYHRLCASILEMLMYPQLTSPIVEQEIFDGRKRIDLMFDNAAKGGFFYRVHRTNNIPAQFIFVECKNYTKDLANPELDQMIGRFSVNHGKVGLLLFRAVSSMDTLLARCSDAYTAQQGLIIPISDEDLDGLLARFGRGENDVVESFLSDRYRRIAVRGG